ncbi:MAG: DUF2200 family protein [Erysipelotrichaceae bacterium]
MSNKVLDMPFATVFQLLLDKAERKGKSAEDVYKLTGWLTGYSLEQLKQMMESSISYGQFFQECGSFNQCSENISGTICNVRIETIDDIQMRRVRCLDKLVDLLVKGKTVEQIIKKYETDSK